MANEEVEGAIAQALAASEVIPEPLRAAGFGVILRHLLARQPGRQLSPRAAAVTRGPALPASLPEFIALKRPKSHPQSVACFAYFRFKSGDTTGLTIKDMEQTYQEIRQKKPQNLSDVIASCVGRGRGWLIPAPERKDGSRAWIITQVGEAAVESNFKTS